MSQGQLLEMHLLESRLLDRKMSSARQKKVCRTCSTCQFRAVDKKVKLLEISSR